MGVNEIYNLLKKYRENNCTPEEKERIIRWYQEYDEDVERLPEIPQGKLDQLWHTVEHRVNTSAKGRRLGTYYQYAVAAAVILIIGIGVAYMNLGEKEVPVKMVKQDILPAKGVVTLQLSDGRQVPLTEVVTLQEQEGVVIKNDSSKVLDYRLASDLKVQSVYNTITVPVGGEYQVLLSDGSKVRLNSCSSLKYPVPFSGETREVELTGEAYFDVVKSGKPFIVKTSDLDIRVLGTSFNVSGYAKDSHVTTTLVEGRVMVKEHGQMKEYVINPGTTLGYSRHDGEVSMTNGDVDLYISWMQGKFKFEDMRLEDIMIKLNRWYDCEVEYSDNSLRDLRFSGAAEKDRPANYLLGMIETVTDVKFEISDHKIIVKHK